MIVTVSYGDLELEVAGNYEPGCQACADDAPEMPYFEIDSVRISGDDILAIIDEGIIQEIAALAAEQAPEVGRRGEPEDWED